MQGRSADSGQLNNVEQSLASVALSSVVNREHVMTSEAKQLLEERRKAAKAEAAAAAAAKAATAETEAEAKAAAAEAAAAAKAAQREQWRVRNAAAAQERQSWLERFQRRLEKRDAAKQLLRERRLLEREEAKVGRCRGDVRRYMGDVGRYGGDIGLWTVAVLVALLVGRGGVR